MITADSLPAAVGPATSAAQASVADIISAPNASGSAWRRSLGPRLGTTLFIAILLASAALILWQSLWHGHLSGLDEYDDGVYFGASTNLAHGLMPYRDFALIQPPFIAILLAPIAFAARVVGTAHAFEAARILIAAVAVANVALVGRLLRGRPAAELSLGMAMAAFYPGAYRSAQTVLLEPVVSMLCLLALVALFEADHVTTSAARHWVAGALLGVAVSTKIWALIPLAVVVVLTWLSSAGNNAAPSRRLLLGGLAAFAVICAPFAALAPATFLRSVFLVQAMRSPSGYSRPTRIFDLTGVRGLATSVTSAYSGRAAVEVLLVAVALLVLASYARLRRLAPPTRTMDRVTAWTAVLLIVSFIAAPMYYYHYSGFLAPFLALASTRLWVVLRVGRHASTGRSSGAASRRPMPLPAVALGSTCAISALVVVLAAVAVSDAVNVTRAPAPAHVSASFRRAVPEGACVLYLDPSLGLLANRFSPARAGCAHVVDYFGAERLLNSGSFVTTAAPPRALEDQLRAWVDASDLVVTGTASPSWGPTIEHLVRQQFVEEPSSQVGAIVYIRRIPRPK